MAIAHVQTQQIDTSADGAVSSPAMNVTAGNLLLVSLVHNTGATFTSISDTAGNVWNLLGTEQIIGFTVKSRTYYAKNITGNASNVVTFQTSLNTFGGLMVVSEFSGVNALDQSIELTDGGSIGKNLVSGASSTRIKADELLTNIGAIFGVADAWTPGSNVAWIIPTNGAITTTNYGKGSLAQEYFIASSAGTEEGEISDSLSTNWVDRLNTFFSLDILVQANCPGEWWDYLPTRSS